MTTYDRIHRPVFLNHSISRGISSARKGIYLTFRKFSAIEGENPRDIAPLIR